MDHATTALFADLRSVQQRVAYQSSFDRSVNRLEAHIREQAQDAKQRLRDQVQESDKLLQAATQEAEKKLSALNQQAQSLAVLTFSSDVLLVAGDGTMIPAHKQTLINNSGYFEAMFAERSFAPYTEASSGEVRTTSSAAALRYLVCKLHCPNFDLGLTAGVDLLEVCELASKWLLDGVLQTIVDAIIDDMDGHNACAALRKAELRMHDQSAWKKLYKEAAKALASTMPAGAQHAEFKMLSHHAILEVMQHLKPIVVKLPKVVGSTAEGFVAQELWSEDISWLSLNAPDRTWIAPIPDSIRFRISVQSHSGSISAHVEGSDACKSYPMEAGSELYIRQPDEEGGQRGLVSASHVGTRVFGLGGTKAGSCEQVTAQFPEGCFTCEASITITPRQQMADVFNMWLLASSDYTQATRTPLKQLSDLRAFACDFDIGAAETEELIAKLADRSLPTDGGRETLQSRLQDAMYSELSSEAIDTVSQKLAGLAVKYFKASIADRSLFELDAASMSQLLSSNELHVKNEAVVLDAAVKWALDAGRTVEVIDKVMPLVRFPLVSMLHKPTDELKSLKARSRVVSELIEEAIKYQVDPSRRAVPPKKHPLLASMPDREADQARTKRRKSCSGDSVPTMDPAKAMLELAY